MLVFGASKRHQAISRGLVVVVTCFSCYSDAFQYTGKLEQFLLKFIVHFTNNFREIASNAFKLNLT